MSSPDGWQEILPLAFVQLLGHLSAQVGVDAQLPRREAEEPHSRSGGQTEMAERGARPVAAAQKIRLCGYAAVGPAAQADTERSVMCSSIVLGRLIRLEYRPSR